MQTERQNKIRKFARVIFIALFFLMLIAPFLDEHFHIYIVKDNIEKRELAGKIPFSFTKNFTKKYDEFYNDNFGFRLLLVDWGGLYKVNVFHASPKPEKTLFGKDDWLFYNDTSDVIVKSYTHRNLLTAEELRFVVNTWIAQKDSCKKLNIEYFRVFWPDKPTIYQELLPFSMKMQIRDTLSKADQILNYLKATGSVVKMIDVRPAMFTAKKDHQLYRKHDSHWNSYGAFVAYRSFFQQVYPVIGIKPNDFNDYNIALKSEERGDLINLLGILTETGLRDMIPSFKFKNKNESFHNLPANAYPDGTIITRNENCGNHIRVLMFRDSYTMALEQFFSQSFYEITFVWSAFDIKWVKQIKPDIVIDAWVERNL
jgi:hypothetical protein